MPHRGVKWGIVPGTVFQGTSALTLDAKGRIAVPSRHRDALMESVGGQLTLTKHPSDCLLVLPRPAWVLLRAYHPSAGDRTEQLSAAGSLRAYFANRVAQPNHTLNVYYDTPPAASAAPAPASPSAPKDS